MMFQVHIAQQAENIQSNIKNITSYLKFSKKKSQKRQNMLIY